jgi:hypothetical protein
MQCAEILEQDNTRYAFLQMDDRALVYRGADQPDMSVINPESDVWQHIKVGAVCIFISILTEVSLGSTALSGDQLAHSLLFSQ